MVVLDESLVVVFQILVRAHGDIDREKVNNEA